MISFIEGVVETAGPLEVVLNCNGVGYRIEVPITTAERIPPAGKPVRLHVCPVYREDSQALYGFATGEERDFFQLLTARVSGIGPKTALSLMSRLSLPLLREAIARGDTALLAHCPGIGRKTAERLCVELKDKLGGFAAAAAAPDGRAATPDAAVPARADAVQALVKLGYKAELADQAVRRACQALGPDAPVEALVRAALRGA